MMMHRHLSGQQDSTNPTQRARDVYALVKLCCERRDSTNLTQRVYDVYAPVQRVCTTRRLRESGTSARDAYA